MNLQQENPHPWNRFTDEELFELFRRGSWNARMVLLERYLEQVQDWGDARAQRWGLKEADINDVRQDMAFVLLKVIRTYRPTRAGKPFCPFRAYLYHALENQLQDLLRREWRTTRYIDGSVTPEGLERLLAAGWARNARHVLSGAGSNPARLAEWRELRFCIVRRVETLDEDCQFVWQEALAGTSLHEIADRGGLSYDRVKRVRRRLQREVLAIVG